MKTIIDNARRPLTDTDWNGRKYAADTVFVTYRPVHGGSGVVREVRLKDLKPKIRKEVQKLLDKHAPSMVECTPVKVVRGVTPCFLKENVSQHVVPRGAAPNDYEPPTITYRGDPHKFRDEMQKAYDSHPDPAFHGKVEIPNA